MAYPVRYCALLMVVATNLCARAFRIVGLGLLLWAGAAAAFPSAPYYPLPDGASWTYTVSGGGTTTRTVVGTVVFNGAPVKVMREAGGSDSYFTNDASGVRLHGGFLTDSGGDQTETNSPPIILAAQDSVFGTPVLSSGATVISVVGIGSFFFNYSATSTPIGVEAVTVPAGNFPNAVRLRTITSYTGDFSFFLDETVWLVPGIGMVRGSSSIRLPRRMKLGNYRHTTCQCSPSAATSTPIFARTSCGATR